MKELTKISDTITSKKRQHGENLTPVQIMEWCGKFWTDREWKIEQLRMCGPDLAQLLRGAAEMIDEYTFKCPVCEMPIQNCVCAKGFPED